MTKGLSETQLVRQAQSRRLRATRLEACPGGAGYHGGAAPVRFRATTAFGVLLWAVLAAGLSPAGAQAEEHPGPGISPLELFKQFISSPPVISNLLFQQKVPMGGGARPLDGTFALSTSFEYFQARRQTDGLLFRRLAGPGDATNFTVAGQLFSVSAHHCALVEAGQRLTTWDDRDPSVAGKTISVFYTSQFMLHPLREVLNLGIMYAGIGAIRWEGSRFRTECEVDHQKLLITGEVVPAGDGPPGAMRVCYAFPQQTNRYVVRYGYRPGLKRPFLPTVIRSFWLPEERGRGPTEVELDEWRILDLEIADAPLPAEAFDAAPFTGQKEWASRIYTNGAVYERGTNGALRLDYALDGPRMAVRRPLLSRAFFYACWGALNFALFALIVGANETNKKQINVERTVTL